MMLKGNRKLVNYIKMSISKVALQNDIVNSVTERTNDVKVLISDEKLFINKL